MKKFFESMKEFFENTKSTIQDDRFSWKFKLLNILTNDSLRFSCAMICASAHNIQDMLREHGVEDCDKKFQLIVQRMLDRNTKYILENLDDIFYI